MTSMIGNTGFAPSAGTNFGNKMAGSNLIEKIPKGYHQGQVANFTPEQMNLYNQQYGLVGPQSYLSRLAAGDEQLFNQIEAPAMRQFQQLQSGLASQFSGQGMGARHSSGFGNAANQQTMDFASQLASQRQGLQRQAVQDLMGISNSLLGYQPYNKFLYEKPQSNWDWGGLAGAGVGAVGGFFAGGGNPLTALQGAGLGYNVGSSFSGKGGQVDLSGLKSFGNYGSKPSPSYTPSPEASYWDQLMRTNPDLLMAG